MVNASDSDPDTRARFQETHWSVVLAAAKGESSRAVAALETLCRAYWPPLYAFIRHRGYSPEEAQDFTQEFFALLLKRNDLIRISPEKGRFRSFLLTALKHFLINEWHRLQSQKRGGGRQPISLDAVPAEARYQIEPMETATPDRVFERHWAFAVLDQTMTQLRNEYAGLGKSQMFDLLKETLDGGKGTDSRAALAAQCGISVGAVDVAVHRLRRRYGELLRSQIAHTVESPDEIEDEIRHLKSALAWR